ncbi:MAG: hypothetical protein IPM29_07430 [Planctomycetes bacterium]|nr:hypothetical protein [Planctomycetota bacterium]
MSPLASAAARPRAVLVVLSAMLASAPGRAQQPPAVSGRYPSLAVLNQHSECGIGAIAPWAGRLWFVTYAPHQPGGSTDRLWSLDRRLALTEHPESIGGTPAGRLVHPSSGQLFIGHHAIDGTGTVRTVSPEAMPARVTAIAEHLSEPRRFVYVVDMEGRIYELDVATLEPRLLFEKPVPGWHGKGAWTSQGVLVVSNNGEVPARTFRVSPYLAGADPVDEEEAGVLAEWDGKTWRIVARRQFTEVTGPGLVRGAAAANVPIWSTGWDARSVLLMVRDQGTWTTWRLPKSDFSYDGRHGWHTEWPRIRDVGADVPLLMTMHGGMFDFPSTFSPAAPGGLRPLATYLKVVADFCEWNGRVVFGCDDVSKFDNPLAGQAQSNLWFTSRAGLAELGAPRGYGGPWLGDDVPAGSVSEPYLFAGYPQRCAHVAHQGSAPVEFAFETGAGSRWQQVARLEVPGGGYRHLELPADLPGDWIRVRVTGDAPRCTVRFHYGPSRGARPDPALFAGLAPVDAPGPHSLAWVRPRGGDLGTLQVLAARVDAGGRMDAIPRHYAMGPDLALQPSDDDEARDWFLARARVDRPELTVDGASVLIRYQGRRYRLPKGPQGFDGPWLGAGWPRAVREAVTERSLLHAHGTFYVLPRRSAGGYLALMPVASHDRRIFDWCSWRGLLVLTGVAADAEPDAHVRKCGDVGVWVGDVDDLWKLGPPCGRGGPWRDTPVRAGVPSDPYLMTGFDHKTVSIAHDGGEPVAVRIEVDVALDGVWHEYATLTVPPGESVDHVFPAGYQAHWVRLVADHDCTATAVFEYR